MAKAPKKRSVQAARRAQSGTRKKTSATQQQLANSLGISAPLRPLVKAQPKASLRELLMQAREPLQKLLSEVPAPWVVFFSFTSAAERAQVVHFIAQDLDHLWQQLNTWQQRTFKKSPQVRWLRVDWITHQESLSWKALPERLSAHKRNYFRYGLALDSDFKQAFLEQELNANAMLYPKGDTPQAGLNPDNFLRYAQSRYNKRFQLPDDPEQPIYLFTTEALFFQPQQAPVAVNGYTGGSEGRDSGRRHIESLDEAQVEQLIDQSSQFLAEQVSNKGRFVYGIHPCFDREINTYNTLRHASTTYAMLEAWEVTQNPELKSAIDRSLSFLTQELIRHYTTASGEALAYLQDQNNEIKLGGNAVCLLALVKYTELTEDRRYLPLLEQLALGIQQMQNPDTGQFTHVLNANDLSVKEVFRIIYYDGEAAFGLMRLYGLTQDQRWLDTVVKAFDYFIAQKHWQIHDHWLSYCVNELTLYRPEERYFQFGIQNVAGHLDFVIERITTFPTLLELMMAAHKMILRLQQSDAHRHLLKSLDLNKFYRALETRAHYLLNGFFWPEVAMYFQNPQRILGSFFIRHHSFRVRIDDVEHYLSGFVAYLRHYLPQVDAQKRQRMLQIINRPPGERPEFLAPSEAPLPEDLAVLFLNLDLGEQLTGIEHSALSRASLFIRELGCHPIVVTQLYRPHLQQRVKELLQSGRYHPDIQVVGLYDLLQGFQTLDDQSRVLLAVGLPPAQDPVFPQYQADPVPGYQDVRYRDDQGRVCAYKVYSKQHGGLTHINYFAHNRQSSGKKIAADFFHASGHCSSHKVMDPDSGKTTHEIYYNPWGQPLFYREFATPDSFFYQLLPERLAEIDADVSATSSLLGKERLQQLLPAADFLGQAADLAYQGLERLVAALPQQRVLLLSDKNKFTLKPALTLRDSSTKAVRILGALHSTHYLGATPQTKIKSHYRELLQERPRPADGLIALTQAQKVHLQERFPDEQVAVIPHTLMAEHSAAGTPPPARDPYKVVYIARLAPEKDHVMAVAIFAEVLKQVPQARLHFYGEGSERRKIQAKIRELQLQDKVILEGYCTDVIPLYQKAACAILTSKMEGFSLSLLEAMAQGCPTLAFDINYGPRDLIVSGETGYLIPYADQALFAQRLVELLTQPEAAARMQAQARERFVRFFAPEKIAALWRRALAGVFADRVQQPLFWTQQHVSLATQGDWVLPPPENWSATGLSIVEKSMQSGHMVAVKGNSQAGGIPAFRLPGLQDRPGALIIEESSAAIIAKNKNTPIYQVQSVRDAVMDLGCYARQQFPGQVIGVTGSAGKTSSVQMMQQLLSHWGKTDASRLSANLPIGIAWNLASMDWQAAFHVVEMAIGRMATNSTLVQPDVAVFLNVGPAHLEYHKTTEQIAIKKSRIFDGMKPGQYAVINRDMDEWPIVEAAAKRNRLEIISFGSHPESDVRWLNPSTLVSAKGVDLEVKGLQQVNLPLGGQGAHIVMNMLAAIGVMIALDLPYPEVISKFSELKLAQGRGYEWSQPYREGVLTFIDDAYNANPLSMKAMLAQIGERSVAGSKHLLLGDMLELGEQSNAYHRELVPAIIATKAASVTLFGEQMHTLESMLKGHVDKILLATDYDQARMHLLKILQLNDLIVAKGSNKLKLSDFLKNTAAEIEVRSC